MESVERSAKTIEEAVELALKELGAQRDEVDLVVLSRGKVGILGLRSEPARVRATKLAQAPADHAKAGREVLETLFQALEVDAKIELQTTSIEEGDRQASMMVFEVEGPDAGLLIGRRGETLAALQFLVGLMLSRRLQTRVYLELDVEHYRERQQAALRNLALRMAERATESGRAITLEPMPPKERRLIHIALAEHPSVTTGSTGEGEQRKVVISPRRSERPDSPQR